MNVRIANKLPQTVRASVRDANGVSVEVVLLPNGVSDAVEESKITAHTKSLVRAGHVRLRPA